MSEFLIIIAYYDKGNYFRRRNLRTVIGRCLELMPESTVCVSEQNTSDAMAEYEGNPRVIHMNSDFGDTFHKTKLLNRAVRENPGYKAYVMCDADAYLDADIVTYIREHWNDAALVFPYSDVLYLNETDTRRIVSGDKLTSGEKDHGIHIGRQTGLCNVFTMDTFNRIGGYDECFSDWGAEDDAFVVKCNRLAGGIVRNSGSTGCVHHLFHPVVNNQAYLESPRYISNRKCCACVRRMSDDDLNLYIAGKTPMSELIDKYENMGRLNIRLKWRCTEQAYLTIDSTIYDIDDRDGVTFTKVVTEVAKEDGGQYAVEFIDTILLKLPDLSDTQMSEIMGLRAKYAAT